MNASYRLSQMRLAVADKSRGLRDWRQARRMGVGRLRDLAPVYRHARFIVVPRDLARRWREASPRPEVGYYADAWNDETYTARVYRLPHGEGFLYGFERSNGWDVVLAREVIAHEDRARMEAKQLARREAERDKAADEQAQAVADAEEAREEARAALKSARLRAVGALRALREARTLNASRELGEVLGTAFAHHRVAMREALARIRQESQKIAEASE